jgi:hypothetical protein
MRRICAAVLVMSLGFPLLAHARNPAQFWAGLAMVAGGGTLAALAGSELDSDTCSTVVYGSAVVSTCVEKPNKGLLWTGVGMASGGAVMMALGARRAIVFGPRSVFYVHRF